MRKLNKREESRKWVRKNVLLMKEVKESARFIRELEEDIIKIRFNKIEGLARECEEIKKSLIQSYMNIIRKTMERVREYERNEAKFHEILQTLKPQEREVVRRRYIEGMKWEDITYAMHYELASITRFEASAMEKIYEYISEKQKKK